MKTDEAKWKENVKKIFKLYEMLYYHMPVQNGMGSPTLDFICCFRGRYFAVETKDSKKDLTERQCTTRDAIMEAGGTVFRVRCEEELTALHRWLDIVYMQPQRPGQYIWMAL